MGRTAAAAVALALLAAAAAGAAGAAAPSATHDAALQPMQPAAALGEQDGGFGTGLVDEETGVAAHAALGQIKDFLHGLGQSTQPGDTIPVEDLIQEMQKPDIKVWNYAHGGQDWDEGVCSVGREQSPIAIDERDTNATVAVGVGEAGAEHYLMHFNYSAREGLGMLFNGHTLAVVGDMGWMETGCCRRTRYKTLSFHFHAPAGHAVRRGNDSAWHAPLELRVVHQRVGAEGKTGLVILSLLFEIDPAHKGAPNEFLRQIEWDEAPEEVHTTHYISGPVQLGLLSPYWNGDFFAYNGSLATPTCDEGVEWRVMKSRAHISEAQVSRIHELLVRAHPGAENPHGNARDLQPLNNRTVVQYHRADSGCHTNAAGAGHCCQAHCCHESCHSSCASRPAGSSCASSSSSSAKGSTTTAEADKAGFTTVLKADQINTEQKRTTP